MKKWILYTMFMLTNTFVSAQSEIHSDSIRRTASTNIKEFGGFLLDMKLMNISPPQLSNPKMDIPNLTKDYNQIFRLNTNAIYTQGFNETAFLSNNGIIYDWGQSSSQFMQMGSFKLKSGMRINTYGDYNEKGWKVPNRNAMPWEKNNFRGAFELKSANGTFGVRFEVQQGRNTAY